MQWGLLAVVFGDHDWLEVLGVLVQVDPVSKSQEAVTVIGGAEALLYNMFLLPGVDDVLGVAGDVDDLPSAEGKLGSGSWWPWPLKGSPPSLFLGLSPGVRLA